MGGRIGAGIEKLGMDFDEELSRIEEIKKVNKIKEHSQVSIAVCI